MDRAMSDHKDGSYLVFQYQARLREKLVNLPRAGSGAEAAVRLEDVLGAIR
jgi:hypothetical protein